MWNGAVNLVGLKKLDLPEVDTANIPHFAAGRVYSGPGGVSSGRGWPNDDVNAKLSRGEGIAVPGFVNWIGHGAWHALNRHFAKRPNGGGDGFHFAPGGIFGEVGNVIGDVVGDIGSTIKH